MSAKSFAGNPPFQAVAALWANNFGRRGVVAIFGRGSPFQAESALGAHPSWNLDIAFERRGNQGVLWVLGKRGKGYWDFVRGSPLRGRSCPEGPYIQ